MLQVCFGGKINHFLLGLPPELTLELSRNFNSLRTNFVSYLVGNKDSSLPSHCFTSSSFGGIGFRKLSSCMMVPFGVSSFPLLSKIATRITQNAASASSTERNWSTFDHQLPKRRSRLGTDLLNDSETIAFNYPLLQRKPAIVTMNRMILAITAAPDQVMLNESLIVPVSDTDITTIDEVDLDLSMNEECIEEVIDVDFVEPNECQGGQVRSSAVLVEKEDSVLPLPKQNRGFL
ncbi:hypothetical protein GEMRC1_000472 [Eukaryota sp. GEM-RC1]